MFGLIASGRMVTTAFVSDGQNAFMIDIPNIEEINHVVVFMTGERRFPDGFAGLIYFCWPQQDCVPSWQLLGYIGNDKPSCVYHLSKIKKMADDPLRFQQFGHAPVVPTTARVGISIESLATVQQHILDLEAAKSIVTAQVEDFSKKMLESFVNYAGSFAVTQSQMVPNPSESYITLSVVQNWYDGFMRKLQNNPNFWKL